MDDTDAEVITGILAATDDDAMPRIVEEFDFLGRHVSIVEVTLGSEDGVRRGHLWHGMVGSFDLEPTRPGLYDDTRWVPGIARPHPNVENALLCYSSVSAARCAASARRRLSKLAGA